MNFNKWMWVALFGAAFSFAACGGSSHSHHHHHDDEEEEMEEHDHEHEHEGHHHDEEADEHEGHEHEHEGHHHDHEDADEHEHEGHDHAHEHAGHNHGSTDEITITPAKAKASGIKSAVIKAADFSEVLEVSGRIENAQNGQVTLVASASGTVKLNQMLSEGASVGQGAALFSISTQAVAVTNPYEQAKITLQAAEQEYKRALKLQENQLISQNRFTEIKERYEQAKLTLNSVGKHYKEGGVQSVHATIGGYVQKCLVKNGDYVEMGQPLAIISANQRLQLRADVPEKYYESLNLVHSAHIKLPSGQVLDLSKMDGRVISRGQSSVNSYYLPVTLSFDSQGKTFPGSFVEVYLLGANRPNVLSVPLKAVIEEQGLHFVFVQLDDDCYRKQEVKTGAQDGQRIEIREGLKSGDKVVVEGAYQVKLASAQTAIPGHSHNH